MLLPLSQGPASLRHTGQACTQGTSNPSVRWAGVGLLFLWKRPGGDSGRGPREEVASGPSAASPHLPFQNTPHLLRDSQRCSQLFCLRLVGEIQLIRRMSLESSRIRAPGEGFLEHTPTFYTRLQVSVRDVIPAHSKRLLSRLHPCIWGPLHHLY